jgi:hypothetical protein
MSSLWLNPLVKQIAT